MSSTTHQVGNSVTASPAPQTDENTSNSPTTTLNLLPGEGQTSIVIVIMSILGAVIVLVLLVVLVGIAIARSETKQGKSFALNTTSIQEYETPYERGTLYMYIYNTV